MALADPHLTHGAEITLDIDLNLLGQLENIQNSFLRRLLSVGEKTLGVLLFTETGILPIRYRRMLIALEYLKYLLLLPQERYASHAIRDSFNLASRGQKGWVTDITVILSSLPFQVSPLSIDAPDTQNINDVMDSLKKGLRNFIQQIIDTSPKAYLLVDRKEPEKNGKLVQKTFLFRHYLDVVNSLARVKGVAAAPGCSRTPVFSNGPYRVTPHLTSPNIHRVAMTFVCSSCKSKLVKMFALVL